MSEELPQPVLSDAETQQLFVLLSALGDRIPEALEPLRLRLEAAMYARTSIAEMEALQQRIREMSGSS